MEMQLESEKRDKEILRMIEGHQKQVAQLERSNREKEDENQLLQAELQLAQNQILELENQPKILERDE